MIRLTFTQLCVLFGWIVAKMAVTDNRSYFNELTLSGFNCCCLTVDEQEYDLFGIVCSDSESEDEWELLESYLTQTKFVNSSSQSMARTKQTARKATGRPPGRSPRGQPLVRFGSPNTHNQGNLLEGDSELEEAANLFAVDMNLPRLQSGSSPGSSSNPSGSPPGQGRASRRRGRSPRSSTPGQGTLPVRGAGRSVPLGLPVNDPPQPSRLQGFLSGRGGFAVRGRSAQLKPTLGNVVASTSSGGSSGLKRLLPSFSSDDDCAGLNPQNRAHQIRACTRYSSQTFLCVSGLVCSLGDPEFHWVDLRDIGHVTYPYWLVTQSVTSYIKDQRALLGCCCVL